jgi:hypothetical protein
MAHELKLRPVLLDRYDKPIPEKIETHPCNIHEVLIRFQKMPRLYFRCFVEEQQNRGA